MPRYKVAITFEGSRIDAVKAQVAKLFDDQEGMEAAVRKVELATSRSARMDEASSSFEDVKTTVEELRDELQEWLDNLPENLRDGDKGSDLQSAIDELESLHGELDGISWPDVEFPGMY